MSTNKMRCILSLLLSVALLSGCNSVQKQLGETQSTLPTLNTGPIISGNKPTEAPPEITQPPKETEPPSLNPVTQLSTIQWQTTPHLLSLGEGKVLACRNHYEEGTGVVNTLEVIDVYSGVILVQEQIDGSREPVGQQFQYGYFVLRDPETLTFYVYDQQLQITKQFSAPNVDGYFSHDLLNYYFVDNNVLYQMDVASGNYARMTLEYDLRFDRLIGVHNDRDVVVAKFYLSFHRENTGVCAIDCKTGKFILLNQYASHLWFDGDTFYAAVTNNSVYGNDICYGSLTDGDMQKIPTSSLGSDTAAYTMLPGSGILMHRTTDDNNLSTTVYDLAAGGISSKLADYGYCTSTLGAVYLGQEQLIFGVYPTEEGFSPVIIDPKVLTYEKSLSVKKEIWPSLVDRSVILDYQRETEGPALPDNLKSQRQHADRLEEKYGITILLGEQTSGFCSSFASVHTNPDTITAALNALDQALSLYPSGFFGQFQNSIHEGGVYFCLTGRIQGSLDPVGITTKNRNRYEITLDITAEALDRTIHHELWHAIEMELSTDSFDHPQWHAANPKGFLYYGHYDSGYSTLTQWTYAQSGKQCYFVDAYSQITPLEDRARIMENVMATDASELLSSPTLQKKLGMMSKAIRDHFDTTGWQTPYWEQYL